MTKPQLQINYGVPCPPAPPHGRRPGSRDRKFASKQAVIWQGVTIFGEVKSYTEAARRIQRDYPRSNTTIKHLAKLIRLELEARR